MAWPSSPPLLPEPDLPSSPILLPDEAVELPLRPSELLPTAACSRKRAHADYGSASSDPLYSEGTSDIDGDDAQDAPRRKRLVRGPYLHLHRRSTHGLRRGMARRERLRIADSGVWIPSDTSDDSTNSAQSSQRRMEGRSVESRSADMHGGQISPSPEALAERNIGQCLEKGCESVDLTDLGLTQLSNATLRPLHQLIRHSHTNLTEPPSEDEFLPLTPSIQLFLSGNTLSSLPSELFRLTNITVLSLRNNNLHYIPQSVGQLPHLKELNIAQNRIKWLPWTMLELFHCRGTHRQLNVRPNPLLDPIPDFFGSSPLPRPSVSSGVLTEHLGRWGETSGAFFQEMKQWYSEPGVAWTARHELELRLKLGRLKTNMYQQEVSRAGRELSLCKEQLIYLASSTIRYSGVDGSLHRNDNGSIVRDEDRFEVLVDLTSHKPKTTTRSSVPSLFELALRSAHDDHLAYALELPDDIPQAVSAALKQAWRAGEYGNELCSACGRSFIVARAEWMEYWFNGFPSQEHLTPESVLPFLRRVCSWGCAEPSDLGAFRL